MNRYPSGSVVACRFAFTLSALTPDQLAAFVAGLGLPSSVTPVTPAAVLFDYVQPNDVLTTLTGSAITLDAPGAYRVDLPVALGGQWRYRGYGQDGSGRPVACTPTVVFAVTPF